MWQTLYKNTFNFTVAKFAQKTTKWNEKNQKIKCTKNKIQNCNSEVKSARDDVAVYSVYALRVVRY